MKVRHRCYSTQWLGGSASGPKRNGSPPLRPTPSGRRSPGAGWRLGRRSYLPGRDERSEERSGRSRSRGGGRCRFVEAEGRSDATPDRSRSRPEVRGGIAFHASCAKQVPTKRDVRGVAGTRCACQACACCPLERSWSLEGSTFASGASCSVGNFCDFRGTSTNRSTHRA